MHILKTAIKGNPNIGLYGVATDKFCLLGYEVPSEIVKSIEKTLKVKVYQLSIIGTSMIGAFIAANDNMVLVPSVAFDEEIKRLESFGIPFAIIDTKLTALGNNILCNEKVALVNPLFSAKIKKRIRQALNVKAVPGTISGIETVGSVAILNKKGMVVHRDTAREETEQLELLFGVPVSIGSVNKGNLYVKSGVIANSNGIIVGKQTTGPELQNLDEGLGFIKY